MARIKYPSPCDECDRTSCREQRSTVFRNCKAYIDRYNWVAKRAKKVMEQGQQKRRMFFRYEHPDIVRSYMKDAEVYPCTGCPREKNCSSLCKKYIRWWDWRMAVARRKLGK